MVLTDGISPDFRGGVHLFIRPSAIGSVLNLSGHAIAYRRRSLPRVRRHKATVVLKVVPVMGAAFAGHHEPVNVRLSFPRPTIGMKWAC